MLKKILVGVVAIVVLLAVVLFGWYQVDGQPLAEASGYLEGEGYTSALESDGTLVFWPAVANEHGVLIMPGALIKPLAYAKAGAYFAKLGYTVYVPSGGLTRLSINAVETAAARMPEFELQDWVAIGHSMGGFSALTLISRPDSPVRAVALWACAMPSDFSDLRVRTLYLRGDRDGLLSPARFAAAQKYLPPDVAYVEVPGGNHRGFALYSHQFFDGEATLSLEEQTDIANAQTAEFFEVELTR